jgi:hypothetical protein
VLLQTESLADCQVRHDLMDAFLRSMTELSELEEAWRKQPGHFLGEAPSVVAARTKAVTCREVLLDHCREHGC